jgi:hypothetical protein
MFTKITKLLIFIVLLTSIIGCSKQPTCDGKETKELVVRTLEPFIRIAISEQLFRERKSIEQTENAYKCHGLLGDLRPVAGEDYNNSKRIQHAKELIKLAPSCAQNEDRFQKISPTLKLENIRTTAKNSELKQVSCAAGLDYLDGKPRRNLTYDLQLTSEDKLYVEIHGYY